MQPRIHGIALVMAFVAGGALPAAAQEPGPAPGAASVQDECAEAYEQAQRARNAGRLLEAQRQAVVCGQDRCSSILRGDCVSWAGELEASIPSVVFDVRHADESPARALEVTIDGRPVARAELGRAIALDPGEHSFAFRDGASSTIATLMVVEGSDRQLVRARFSPRATPAITHATSRRKRASRALLGVSAAGLAGFMALATAGYLRERDLEDRCAPSCGRARAEPIERRYLAADVSVGLAVLAGGLGFWSWLGDPERRSARGQLASAGLSISGARGRASLTLSTPF